MPTTNYPRISNTLTHTLSTQLARMSQGKTLETLQQDHPKLSQALTEYSKGDLGIYYRTVGNARKECAMLRFGQAKALSGTLLTETETKQPIYEPRYTAAIGFLITDPSKIHRVHDQLLIEFNEPRQSQEDININRQRIVKSLKKGLLQNRIPRSLGYGSPRQDAVNESIIDYNQSTIAAIIIPKRTFDQPDSLDNLAKAKTVWNSHAEPLETGRITAQLSYVTTKLGDLPILTFDGTSFENLNLSQEQWQDILKGIDANAHNPIIHTLLKNPDDFLYSRATGLQTAMMEVNALDKNYDIHEMKEIGGAWTSLPVDFTRFVLRINR